MEKIRDNTKTVSSLIYFVRKQYRLAFLKYLLCEKILTQKEVSNLLAEIWTKIENVNHDINVGKSTVLKWIKKADKEVLMNQEELDFYNSLPSSLIIYRGAKEEKAMKGLCWTLDKGMAEWFAKRFSNEGYVFEASINKEDVIAFTDARSEKEVIVDYTKLHDVKSYYVS